MHKYSNNAFSHRQDLKDKILRTSMPMFKRNGIKSVRMDDIANRLSISKRTLYEIYNNKEDLLLECVKLDNDDFAKQLQDYAMTAENELDIVVTFFRLKLSELDDISPLFFEELNKYANVKEYFRKRHDEQKEKSTAFINKCIEKGFFNPNIRYEIVQDICDRFITSNMAEEKAKKYSLREVFHSFFIVLLRGFCTEKGLILLDQYIQKSNI